jgi:2,3-bisphosphoglycerate-independent phosphoglycerate mutase
MTQYKSDYPFDTIFPPQTMDNVLAQWVASKNTPQSHIAETEKYAHVTFFFNGGTEQSYPLEDRELVASPKVATYDLKPEMSAIEVAQKVAEVVSTSKYGLVIMNFAPPDMVGHTGVYEAAIKGVEATDAGIGIIYEACKKAGYTLFVTSDHGNAEKMKNFETGEPHTAHTTNPVPFIMTSDIHKFGVVTDAALCDVAPTVLEVMGLSIPAEMTGKSLLKK